MAEVEIEYNGKSFEENPQIITWIQLYFIKILRLQGDQEPWVVSIREEWEYNFRIERLLIIHWVTQCEIFLVREESPIPMNGIN